jgi:hypothetical protein
MLAKSLILSICLLLIPHAWAGQPVGKPIPPVNVKIIPQTAITAGQSADFAIEVRNGFGAATLSLDVHSLSLPSLTGDTNWRGEVGRNQPVIFKVSAVVPASGVFEFSADVQLSAGGTRYLASDTFRFGRHPAARSFSKKNRTVKKRLGREIVEIKLP